jgi:hypothetical protein
MRNLMLLILIAATMFACADSTAPQRYEDSPYYVINGKLLAGSPITLDNPIFIGRTAGADGGNLTQMIAYDAEVRIYEVDGAGSQVGDPHELAFAIQQLEDKVKMGYVDTTLTFIPHCGHTYRVVAGFPGTADSVWAETSTPDSMYVTPDECFTTNPVGPYPDLKWETSDSQHPLRARLQNQNQFNLFVQFYCLEDSYENVEWTITFGSEDKPQNQDEYEDPGSQQPRKIEFFYRAEPEWMDDGYYIRESRFKSFVWFYGPYRVTYYSIDDNYFNYLYQTEGYNHGGVHNGLGYFGSATGTVLYTKFVR